LAEADVTLQELLQITHEDPKHFVSFRQPCVN
jgi:hypothetical protein